MSAKNFSSSQRRIILARDNYTCAYCGESATEVDHVNPRANGGRATLDNGVAVCESCNRRKWANLDITQLARGFFVASLPKWPSTLSLADQAESTPGRRSARSSASISGPIRKRRGPAVRHTDKQSIGAIQSVAVRPLPAVISAPRRPSRIVFTGASLKFPNNLVVLRQMHNLSQDQLARKVGIPRTRLSFLESGRNLPTWNALCKFMEIWEVSLAEIYPNPKVRELIAIFPEQTPQEQSRS